MAWWIMTEQSPCGSSLLLEGMVSGAAEKRPTLTWGADASQMHPCQWHWAHGLCSWMISPPTSSETFLYPLSQHSCVSSFCLSLDFPISIEISASHSHPSIQLLLHLSLLLQNQVSSLRSICMYVPATQSCPTLCDPWTAACQAPFSIEFPRQ